MHTLIKKTKVKKKSKKGSTLIEILIGMLIFALIMVGVFMAFTKDLQNRTELKKTQDAVESLTLALDVVSKNLRTGTYKSSDSTAITYTDHEDGLDRTISLSGNTLSSTSVIGTIIEDVEGNFAISAGAASNKPVFVTITLRKKGKPATQVQTSVVMRSYQ